MCVFQENSYLDAMLGTDLSPYSACRYVYTCVGVCLLRVVGWLEIVAERVCMCAAILKPFFEPLLGLLSKA